MAILFFYRVITFCNNFILGFIHYVILVSLDAYDNVSTIFHTEFQCGSPDEFPEQPVSRERHQNGRGL